MPSNRIATRGRCTVSAATCLVQLVCLAMGLMVLTIWSTGVAAEPQGFVVLPGKAPRVEGPVGSEANTMQELPYGNWREYDPEDTIRFYALRLHEAGMIKSTPQKIIAQGTDWRFLNELKRELKG
jgi:hypothetical protein